MDLATILGFAAALASTISFAPQAWKIIKSRRTADISAGTYSITVLAFALWLAYGALLAQWPLILTNALCFVLAGFILVMKLLPADEKRKVAEALDPSARGAEEHRD